MGRGCGCSGGSACGRRGKPAFESREDVGAGVAIPLRGLFEGGHRRAIQERPEAVGQMVGDVPGRQVQAARPPTGLTGAVGMGAGAPGEGGMRAHQGDQQQAPVRVEFVKGVVAIGHLAGGAGKREGCHGEQRLGGNQAMGGSLCAGAAFGAQAGFRKKTPGLGCLYRMRICLREPGSSWSGMEAFRSR